MDRKQGVVVTVKILSYKSPQRYAVRRMVLAAQSELRQRGFDVQVAISEVRELAEIEQYTSVVILPSLVVNDKLVCVGRFPSKDEISAWLAEALAENGRQE